MSEDQFRKLAQKLDILIKLTALNALKGKNKTEQILLLRDLGLNRQQIADIVDTTPLTVSVTISQDKAKTKKIKKKEREPSVQNKQESL